MEKRSFLITCEMNDDLSQYDLVAYLNGREIKRNVEYSLGDMCIDLQEFQYGIYEEYEVDTRSDSFKVKIDVYC